MVSTFEAAKWYHEVLTLGWGHMEQIMYVESMDLLCIKEIFNKLYSVQIILLMFQMAVPFIYYNSLTTNKPSISSSYLVVVLYALIK